MPQSGGANAIISPPGGNKKINDSPVTIALTTHKKVPFHLPDAAIMTLCYHIAGHNVHRASECKLQIACPLTIPELVLISATPHE